MGPYEGLIEVLFSAISLLTVFVVIFLNYRANKMAEIAMKETQLTTELENRPYVYFHIVLENGNFINLKISNRGKGIARNIKMTIDQPVKVQRRRDGEEQEIPLPDLAIFRTISFLAPKMDFTEYADMGHVFFRYNEGIKEITGKIQYENAAGKKYTTRIHINLEALAKRMDFVQPEMHNLVEVVDRIERMIQRIK